MRLLNLFILFVFVSCANSSLNVDLHIPKNRPMSAETLGERNKIGIDGFIHGDHKVSLMKSSQGKEIFSNDITAVSVSQITEESASLGVGLQGRYALLDRLDLFLRKSNEAPLEIGTQFQVFGEPGPKGTGSKISIYGSVGYQEDEEHAKEWFASDDDEFENVNAFTNFNSKTIGGLFGLRLRPSLLVFVHAYHQYLEVRSRMNISDGRSFAKDLDMEQNAASIGLRINSGDDYIQIEGGISKLRLQREGRYGHRSWALSSGLQF